MTGYLRYGVAVFALLLFAFNAYAMTEGTASELGKSLGDSGAIYGEGSISGLSAEQELGVSAEGDMDGEGRNIATNYRQVLSNQIECPAEVGKGGKRVMIQQFATQCETAAGTSRRIWVCIPSDINDVADRDCGNGNWFSAATSTTDNQWKKVVKGLKLRLKNCQSTTCTLELEKGGSFEGGQAAAQSEGEKTLANSQGAAEAVKNQGAALPDGTVLQPGKNENSGEYVGEMVAAGDVGECVGDVQASLDSGTPVFTCDGKKQVGMLTAGTGDGQSCVDEKVCTKYKTKLTEYEKSCETNVDYQTASCNLSTKTVECQVENVAKEIACTETTQIKYIGRSVFNGFKAPINQVTEKPKSLSDNLKGLWFFSGPLYGNWSKGVYYIFFENWMSSNHIPDGSKLSFSYAGENSTYRYYNSYVNGSYNGKIGYLTSYYAHFVAGDKPNPFFIDQSKSPYRPMTVDEAAEFFGYPKSRLNFRYVGETNGYGPPYTYLAWNTSNLPTWLYNRFNFGKSVEGPYLKYVNPSTSGDTVKPEYYAQGYRLHGDNLIKLETVQDCEYGWARDE